MARILVLDDKSPDRSVIADVLEREGHDVVALNDGDAGITRFGETPFDLVLLDLTLPRKGGSSTLVRLVTEFAQIKVLITARGPETISTRGYLDIAGRGETVRALPKPFSPARLVEAVRVLLEGGEWIRAGLGPNANAERD